MGDRRKNNSPEQAGFIIHPHATVRNRYAAQTQENKRTPPDDNGRRSLRGLRKLAGLAAGKVDLARGGDRGYGSRRGIFVFSPRMERLAMATDARTEQEVWSGVKDMLGRQSTTLGPRWSRRLRVDPIQLAFTLSRYKFAAKLACRKNRVLELGCGEGIGCSILAENVASYLGVDRDAAAIQAAETNWKTESRRFQADDFLGKTYGEFDAVVALDVIEHISPENETAFLDTVSRNLNGDGICVIGTPNLAAAVPASGNQNGLNLYDPDRLAAALDKVFHTVLRFAVNDEVVHTGGDAMAHYLIHVGCYKRKQGNAA
ncbi:MAG: class I SAM-dependent methyltransferase [Planctomycetales bacterium]